MNKTQATLEDIKAATMALAEKGLIYDSGERRNGQIVWKLTPNVIAFPKPQRKRPTAPSKRKARRVPRDKGSAA